MLNQAGLEEGDGGNTPGRGEQLGRRKEYTLGMRREDGVCAAF